MYIYTALFIFTFFIIGACIGSFINMAVYRTHNNLSFFGKSFCDKCKKKLTAKELIPIFSYFINKGRCGKCGYSVPFLHVVVELSVAILFTVVAFVYLLVASGLQFESLSWFFYNTNISFVYYLIIISCLVFIFIYDLKYFEVPYPPIIILFISFCVFTFLSYLFYKEGVNNSISSSQISKYLTESGFVDLQLQYFKTQVNQTLVSSLFIGLFFFFLFAITRGKGMGFGDVYTAPVLALLAGFPNSVLFIISSFVFGALYGVYAIIFLKAGRKTAVPFAPFMVMGLLFSLTVSAILTSIYL